MGRLKYRAVGEQRTYGRLDINRANTRSKTLPVMNYICGALRGNRISGMRYVVEWQHMVSEYKLKTGRRDRPPTHAIIEDNGGLRRASRSTFSANTNPKEAKKTTLPHTFSCKHGMCETPKSRDSPDTYCRSAVRASWHCSKQTLNSGQAKETALPCMSFFKCGMSVALKGWLSPNRIRTSGRPRIMLFCTAMANPGQTKGGDRTAPYIYFSQTRNVGKKHANRGFTKITYSYDHRSGRPGIMLIMLLLGRHSDRRKRPPLYRVSFLSNKKLVFWKPQSGEGGYSTKYLRPARRPRLMLHSASSRPEEAKETNPLRIGWDKRKPCGCIAGAATVPGMAQKRMTPRRVGGDHRVLVCGGRLPVGWRRVPHIPIPLDGSRWRASPGRRGGRNKRLEGYVRVTTSDAELIVTV